MSCTWQFLFLSILYISCSAVASSALEEEDEGSERNERYAPDYADGYSPSRNPLGYIAAILPLQIPNPAALLRSLLSLLVGNTEDTVVNPSKSVGGYPNFLCPRFDEEEKAVFFPCAIDCEHNHGGLTGKCGSRRKNDYNCYCSGYNEDVDLDGSNQCWIPHDKRHIKMCNVDCRCNHGASGGICDWNRRACVCSYGSNQRNVGCNLENYAAFAKYLHGMVGPEKLGKRGVYFINLAIQHYANASNYN